MDAGLRVTSVDASAGALRLDARAPCGRAAPRDGNPVLRGDLQRLDLPDAAFDAAVCAEVLEHLDDDAAAAARAARGSCAPAACCVVTVPANPYRYDWTDRWAGHRRRYTVPGPRGPARGRRLRRRSRSQGWGFPLTGLYHRQVYRRALRRRLAAGEAAARPAARRRSWPRGWCARRSRSTRPSSAAAPATTACSPMARRRDRARLSDAAGRPTSSPLRRWGGLAAGVLVLGFLGWALVDGWSAVSQYDWDLEPAAHGARRASCCWSSTWRAASATARSSTACTPRAARRRATLSIWARSLLGRYVPGNVLMVVGRVVLSYDRGRPAARRPWRRRSTSRLLTLGVAAAGRGALRGPLRHRGGGAGCWLLALLPLGLVLLHPRDLRARVRLGCCARPGASRCRGCSPPGPLAGAARLVRAHRGPARHGRLAAGALGRRPRGRQPGLRRPGLPALVRGLDAGVHLPLGARGAGGRLRASRWPSNVPTAAWRWPSRWARAWCMTLVELVFIAVVVLVDRRRR